MNIVFVCHGDLASQSTYHVLSIAEQLASFGHHCVACIPSRPRHDLAHIRKTAIPILDFAVAAAGGLSFPDRNGPTLIHCWTPREQVRAFTERLSQQHACPYFVHLEDNEREILNRELVNISYEELIELPPEELDTCIHEPAIRIHPLRHWKFLQQAAGCTVLLDRLKEHVPTGTPVQVFWPGPDECFTESSHGPKDKIREQYKVAANQFVVLYAGAIHSVNYDEVSSMVTALKILVNRGMPLTFVKTGRNDFPDLLKMGIESGWIKDLGFLPRETLPEIFQLSDALIQPGRSDPFNSYRFPSKLPEALAQKLPVILPDCNLGQALRDGVDALITHTDSMEELIGKIVWLYENPEEKTRIGDAGWHFCTQHLNWATAARLIDAFYSVCLHGTQSDLSRRGLIQEATTDFRRVSTLPTSDKRSDSLNAPIAPRDIHALLRDEIEFKGNGTALADAKTLRATAFSKLLSRSRKKAGKYKRLSILQSIAILLLLLALYLHV